MQPRDYALELVGSAENDAYVVKRLIDDPAAPDTMLGFHCQQASEKLLKAVLATRGAHFRRSHNLDYLVDLVADSGAPVPANLRELANLNPFAATLRYGQSQADAGFDRQHMWRRLEELRQWTLAQVTA